MTLSEASTLCPGLRLRFIPKYGWGWKAPGDIPSLVYDQIEEQGAIDLEVESAFKWEDEFRGLYGVVATDNHLLKGYNFILWSMGQGVIDPVDGTPHRWDLFFSHQPFRADHVDFPDQEEAGIGYGSPTLSNDYKTEQSGPDNSRPFGTSGMSPADSASRAGDMPEASGSI